MFKKEDNSHKLDVKTGDNSTAVQAGRDVVIHQGLSVTDAKNIFDLLFKENFLTLRDEARDIANQRASELVTEFLTKLQSKNPDSIENTKNPDIQYVVYEAQKSHARRGDQELSNLLVDLLVKRTVENEDELISVVFNEALATVPKLTKQQIDVLSVCFIFRYSKFLKISQPSDLIDKFNTIFSTFLSSLSKHNSSFQHIEYAGCGNVSVASTDLVVSLGAVYPALFSKGFSLEQYKATGLDVSDKGLIIRCFNNPELIQFSTMEDTELLSMLEERKFPKDVQDRAINLFKSTIMNKDEILQNLINLCPDFEKFNELWSKSNMKSLTLTSVGIAIAQSNLRAKASMEYDLKAWLK